ncbi:MAG TPA: MarR family transcriptional regulator [Armatimonadota bacterium]|nr:MarR family transcriptional regulator [Armatimonadota bacterium]
MSSANDTPKPSGEGTPEWLLPSVICTAMMRVGTRMATVFDQHFSDMGITQAQFRTLLRIWETGGEEGIAPSALAEELLLERATVTVLTARLVERGLLARRPGVNRRTFCLVLTPAGRELMERVLPRAVGLADETLAGMAPAQLTAMLHALQRIEERVRTSSPGDERAGGDRGKDGER